MTPTEPTPTDETRPCVACGTTAICGRPCPRCGAVVPAKYVGVIVGGKYRVEGLLGWGGMGSVYHALHTSLNDRVAVKFLHAQWTAYPDARERFRREVVALVRLRHPGIVSIFDAGEHEGVPYMVMELLRGRTLASLLGAGKRTLPLPRAAALFGQIAQVLDAAHQIGVIHRDMKPENVFLLDSPDGSDRVKLFDFGIAQVHSLVEGASRLTQQGVAEGTPYYMSPEQCRGLPVSPTTDVYALGVMLFEALTGEMPFSAESPTEILAQHLYLPPPRAGDRGTRPALPPGVEALLQQMLAKEPAARPTARQFIEMFSSALAGSDPASMRSRALADRERHAVLSREERALSDPPPPSAAPASIPGRPLAVVWHHDPSRASSVLVALGLGGLAGTAWTSASLPPALLDGAQVKVILLPAGPRAADSLRALRQSPELKGIPTMVFDLLRADEIPTYIRAGAGDAVLYAAGDPELAPKATRLARRGR